MNDFLPDGWEEVELGFIADWSSGGTPSSKERSYYNGDIPWLIISDLNDGYVTSYQKTISQAGLESSSAKIVLKGSVLISIFGSIGKLGIAGVECTTNQAIAFTQVIYGGIQNQYIFYALLWLRPFITELGKGGAQKNINLTLLKEIHIPLAPLSEQQRIVNIVEERMQQVDQSRQQFQKLKDELRQYRQEILTAAVSGQLTEDWREEETVYNDIPENWESILLGNIAEISGGITLNAKRKELPLKVDYLRVANVYANRLVLDEIKQIGVTEAEKRRTELKKGDLLVVEGNGSLDQIGRVAMWDGSIEPCLHQNHLFRLRFANEITARYALLYLLSPPGREKIVDQSASTSGLFNLSLSKISALEIALPPVEEQHEILRRVAEQIEAADALEASYNEAIAEVEALPQIILAKAFAGELTEQDPNDEPASALLERIRIEREAAKNAPKQEKDKTKRLKKMAEAKLLEVIQQAFVNDPFTFEQLRSKTTKGYEALRDELYGLIEVDKKIIHQFDPTTELLTFSLATDAHPTNKVD